MVAIILENLDISDDFKTVRREIMGGGFLIFNGISKMYN